MMPPQRMFLSHSSRNKDFVNELLRRLQDHGVDDAWYDIREISATSGVPGDISGGIAACDYFAIVLTPEAAQSQWVSFEIQTALNLQKPVLALLYADQKDAASALFENPFVSQLLQGGGHKILDFQTDFNVAFLELLREIAPEEGKRATIAERLHAIFDGDDPDEAERAMGFAALDVDETIPHLLTRLRSLRDSRRQRFRGERLVCGIGQQAIVPLLMVMSLDHRIPQRRQATLPPGVLREMASGEEGVVLTGQHALDFIRWITVNPVAQDWSAQLGAEYCLIALGKHNARLQERIVTYILHWLRESTSSITAYRDQGETPDDGFFDSMRLMIETAGELAPHTAIDAFLVKEFMSDHLWGSQAEYAKNKLCSYIVTFLSRVTTDTSLRYLFSIVDDPTVKQRYFVGDVVPDPFLDCFVPFGTRAVEPLLKRLEAGDSCFTLHALMNLAAIASPFAAKPVLQRVLEGQVEGHATDTWEIIRRLGGNTVPATATQLLQAWRDHHSALHLDDPEWRNRVGEAAAVAARYADDRSLSETVCGELLEATVPWVLVPTIRSIAELGLFRYYDKIKVLFESAGNGVIRGHAAIALARRDAIMGSELKVRLAYAETNLELPLVSVALSYFDDDDAIPGLIKGLNDTFDRYQDKEHHMFADALARMSSVAAAAARAKWYNRR